MSENYIGILNANGDTVLSQTDISLENAREMHFSFDGFFNAADEYFKLNPDSKICAPLDDDRSAY